MSHAAFTIRELPDGGACLPGMETGCGRVLGKRLKRIYFQEFTEK